MTFPGNLPLSVQHEGKSSLSLLYDRLYQRSDDGRYAAVGGTQVGTRPRTAEIKEVGRIYEKARRGDEANRRATLSDDTQTGG